jgi:hypothetical protein
LKQEFRVIREDLVGAVSRVVGYSPDSNDVRREAEESQFLRSVTGK